MSDVWFVSDQHYNHTNLLTFKDQYGNLLRPFNNVEHMNETMIELHNEVVKPEDKVYFGGDIGRNVLNILQRLNGKKSITLGNHDKLSVHEQKCFQKITSWRFFGHVEPKFVLSHYPLHPMSFEYRGGGGKCFNVHGHIHDKIVLDAEGNTDKRYLNICVERIGYKPVHMDEILAKLRNRTRTYEI